MASPRISSTKPQTKSQGFTVVLSSAVFEWLLMLFLFIGAIFSYLLTRFARYCELQTPCLLCSRLDHVLGNEKVGFHWDLVCRNHKFEISSLVFCHDHNKLVDGHGMCESCLFSFATANESNAETYGKRRCSCCNVVCIPTCYNQKLLELKSNGFEASQFDLPFSGAVVCGFGYFNNRKDKPSRTISTSEWGDNEFDLPSHIRYTELKITSDTESDELLSDDDDRSTMVCEPDGSNDNFEIKRLRLDPCTIASSSDLISEIPINPPPFIPEPSHVVSVVKSVVVEPNVGTHLAPTIATDHGLEELTWQQAEPKTGRSPQTELISLDPPSQEASSEVFRENSSEFGQACTSETHEICKTVNSTTTAKGMTILRTGPLKSNSFDLGDAYKLAVGNRAGQLSGLLSEQWSVKDSSRVKEDIKLLLSQISTSRGIELNDTSPRVSMNNNDDLKSSDADTGSIGLHTLRKRVSLERNESGFESLDGSVVSEIEGETLADRLKRQAEHDRKSLVALYKELDEERNASAVAASQAMAMITRLQQEKAVLHMEALQYLRMMEEQAEYDMEALQKSNRLLDEKGKEIQDLEEELDFYRTKFPYENATEDKASLPGNSDIEKPIFCDKVEVSDPSVGVTNIGTVENPLSGFEDERIYILRCLKKLEKKLQLFSNKGACLDFLRNGEYSGNEGDEGSALKDVTNECSVVEENRGSPSLRDERVLFGKEDNFVPCRVNDLDTLGVEVSDLNDRLEALEANRSFLENTINSLKGGDEGLEFVQEIARHLRDLRNGVRRGGSLTVT